MSTVHVAVFLIVQACQLLERSESDISEALLRFQLMVRRFDCKYSQNYLWLKKLVPNRKPAQVAYALFTRLIAMTAIIGI